MPPVDPQQRLAARNTVLNHQDAQNCTLYRPDENDPDGEEMDLGDAKIVFTGTFEAPADWDEHERSEFYSDSAPELFVTARIECEAKPATSGYFEAEPGDFVATMPGSGEVVMYFVYDFDEDADGRSYVLIRDDESLD
ncbi:hypothetical protein NVV93_12395 [Pseudomonas sp. LS44]|uniref:hypothetical protein n=1 Tax=Pseudomonas sp. LS44 TaxID=1357074 RepID=UPI00215AA4C2|nr:hypothetical protein [Pseudomonas sp. LS44]UVE16412.1 hypothetical protein NVV93_12395 [Pseudomonas sp. LS44]